MRENIGLASVIALGILAAHLIRTTGQVVDQKISNWLQKRKEAKKTSKVTST